jgi:hypothetical protein
MTEQFPTLTEAFQSAVQTIQSDRSIHSVTIEFQMNGTLMEGIVERPVLNSDHPQIRNIRQSKGSERQQLVAKAKKIMKQGTAACYSELYSYIREDMALIAQKLKLPEAFVALCVVDDIEADLDDNLGFER